MIDVLIQGRLRGGVTIKPSKQGKDYAIFRLGVIDKNGDSILCGCITFETAAVEAVQRLLPDNLVMQIGARVAAALPRLRGAFALAIAFKDYPDMLIGARLGSPLVVGYGDGETYLGSDALALAPLTQQITYLDEGDWAIITRDGTQIFDHDNNPVKREVTTSGASAAAIE